MSQNNTREIFKEGAVGISAEVASRGISTEEMNAQRTLAADVLKLTRLDTKRDIELRVAELDALRVERLAAYSAALDLWFRELHPHLLLALKTSPK